MVNPTVQKKTKQIGNPLIILGIYTGVESQVFRLLSANIRTRGPAMHERVMSAVEEQVSGSGTGNIVLILSDEVQLGLN